MNWSGRKERRCLAVLVCALTAGGGSRVLALQPPSPEQIATYAADGTLAQRIADAQALGNHIPDPYLVWSFQQRIREARAQALGLPAPTEYAPPPAWRGGLPYKGTARTFVLLIEFPNNPHAAEQTQADVQSKMFGDGVAADRPYESIRNYYKRSSYDQLTIEGTVFAWYTAQKNRTYYENLGAAGREALIMEALADADARGHDFTQYDGDGDGKIDAFYVKWTGPIGEWASFWWAYQTGWYVNPSFTLDGKRLGKYVWSWIASPPTARYSPRVDIHETGHLLGLPDYYDYDGNIGPDGGVGGLDMMDGNWGDHNCFSKALLEWVTPTVIATGSQTLTLRPSGTSQDCVLLMPTAVEGNYFGEFFMAQYRKKDTGNDPSNYPTDGLLVWHVDSTLSAGNYLYDNSYTEHKLLRLMEADGLEEIEKNKAANAGDFYKPPKTFGPDTTPNSNSYAGEKTGVLITGLGAPGATMSGTFAVTLRGFRMAIWPPDAGTTVPPPGTEMDCQDGSPPMEISAISSDPTYAVFDHWETSCGSPAADPWSPTTTVPCDCLKTITAVFRAEVPSQMDAASPETFATRVKGKSRDQLGGGYASVAYGDVNGDGYDDLVIGAPGRLAEGSTTTVCGASVLYGGIGVHKMLSEVDLAGGGMFSNLEGAGGNLGVCVAVGDFNGDGYDDVAIGAPDADGGAGYKSGEAWIVYGQAGLIGSGAIAGLVATQILGDDMGDQFGYSMAAGDLNADGIDDLVIGAPGADPPGGDHAGEVYVFYGSPAMASTSLIDLTQPAGSSGERRLCGDDPNDQLGAALACADVNGDGFDDVIGGAMSATTGGGTSTGEVLIWYGSSDTTPGIVDFNATPGSRGETRIEGDDSSDYAGHAVAAGDINGDGYADVLIGAHMGDPPGGSNAGEAYVIFGGRSRPGQVLRLWDATAPVGEVRVLGDNANDAFGWSVAAGDTNGDGFEDICGGALTADPFGRADAGKAYAERGGPAPASVVDLNNPNPDQREDVLVLGAATGDRLGSGLAAGADFDRDGLADLVVTAPKALSNAGLAYLVYGRTTAGAATVRHYDRAGDAPPRDFGPTGRCTIDYAGGGGPSLTEVTITRSWAVTTQPPGAARVMWQVTTDRTGPWSADVTLRYLDAEVAGLNEDEIMVLRADTPAGPFRPLPTTVDKKRNEAKVSGLTAMGVFVLKAGCNWTVEPTEDQYLDLVEGADWAVGPVEFTIQNVGPTAMSYVVSSDCEWVTLGKTGGGPLEARTGTDVFTVSLNDLARQLPPGQHTCVIRVQDQCVGGLTYDVRIVVTVVPCGWTVTEAESLVSIGEAGGPFAPDRFDLDVANTGQAEMGWSVAADANWVTLEKTGGTLEAGATDRVGVSLNENASSLAPGVHVCTLTFAADCGATRTLQKTIELRLRAGGCFPVRVDGDGDGDVDLDDFVAFQLCFNGSGRPWSGPPADPQRCACLDQDSDEDVDLADFAAFQTCFNGASRPASCLP